MSTTELVRRLNSSLKDGLSEEQVKTRLQRYGKNAPSPPQTHRFKTVVGYFFKGFGSVLLVAAILVFIAWRPLGDPPAQANLALAIVLFAVFLIQAAFNMWQDWSSSRVMASIKDMLPDECQVLRDGAQLTLFASELVPGDILLIKAGNKLPADVRLASASSDAKFDRSILTGKYNQSLFKHRNAVRHHVTRDHFEQVIIVPQEGLMQSRGLLFWFNTFSVQVNLCP